MVVYHHTLLNTTARFKIFFLIWLVLFYSGDVFVGRKPKHVHPFRMPMLGHYIVVAVIKQLIQDYRINRKGVKVTMETFHSI